VTADGRDAGHHDRAQTNAGGLRDGGKFVPALPLQLVGELDNQDSIFRNQPDQRHETNLRINIQRCGPAFGEKRNVRIRHFQKSEEQRSEHGERHRAEQDDERIAEAVELRGEDEKNQNNREGERGKEFVSFSTQLTRVARVIEDVTFRQNLARFGLEKRERGVEWLAGDAGDLHRVERRTLAALPRAAGARTSIAAPSATEPTTQRITMNV